MLFTTPTQFAVLALCLFAGWLFGLASHPGGKRAKAKLYALQTEHATYKQDAEVRIKKAEERAKAAETDRDRLARVEPVATQPRVATTDRVATQSEARPMDRF